MNSRWHVSARAGAAVVAAYVLLGCSAASAAQLQANPGTLRDVFARAGGGDTILLAGGDYGTLDVSMKPGMVTLKAAPGVTARIEALFTPAANVTLDGVNLEYAVINGEQTKNIVIRNSDVTGLIVLRTNELANANILLDRNVHRDWDACGHCPEGRITLLGQRGEPSGVTISNSVFRGGLSDGIQDTSRGTRIIGNTFRDIPFAEGGAHVDALQLYGSEETLVRGNYFTRVPTAIMAPDGVSRTVIEHNVIAGDPLGYPYAISLGSDDGSIIRHNTFADGACGFNLRCGVLSIGSKDGQPGSRGTIIQDNILGSIATTSGSADIVDQSHNLIRGSSVRPGSAELRGLPTYVGGASPDSLMGYTLANGSPGKSTASDGSDRGANTAVAAGPTPALPSPVTGAAPVGRSVTCEVNRGRKRVTASCRLKDATGARSAKLRLSRRGRTAARREGRVRSRGRLPALSVRRTARKATYRLTVVVKGSRPRTITRTIRL